MVLVAKNPETDTLEWGERVEAVAQRLDALRLGGGRLGGNELESVVSTVAADRWLWEDLVAGEPTGANRRLRLHLADNFEVLLIAWGPFEQDEWHDHGAPRVASPW